MKLDYYDPMIQIPRLLAIAILATHALACVAAAQTTAADNAARAANERLVVYEVLVSEFSMQGGDPGAGFAYMLDAARRANSDRLYERAVEMGLSARNANDALQAAQAWSKALPSATQAHRYEVQILIGLNRLEEVAEPLYRMLQTGGADDRNTHLALLPNYFARVKDRKAAVEVVQQALADELTNPKLGPSAWAAIARMQAFAGDETQAIAALEKSTALDAKSDEAALAALQIGGKVVKNAQALIQKRLAQQPGPGLRMAVMRSHVDAQNYAAAYEQLQQLTREAPDYAEAWLVKGSLEVQNNQLDLGERSLENFLQLLQKQTPTTSKDTQTDEVTPRSKVEALLLMATIAERKKDFTKANNYLDSISSPSHQTRIQIRRASVAAAQGNVEEARALLQGLPANNAEALRARYNAELQLLRERNLTQQAHDLAREAAQALPDDPVWRYEQAMLAEKLGRISDMEALLRNLIASHPQYHPPYNALGYSLADRNVSLPEARQLIIKALEFAPEDAYIIDSMGWVEYRGGNLKEARRLLEKAFAAQPDAEIAAHLGEVLWKLGEQGGARTLWQKGLALNPTNATLLETMGRFQFKP
jgi:tetratricopeptide (TPR) repeat protein